MTSKKLAAIAAVAALAAPTAAIAANEHANGHSGSHGQGSAKGHAKAKNTVFKGTVVSTDATAGSITIHVLKASHWGTAFKGTDVTFTVATVKKVNVADTNADGKRDLADFKANDPVLAQARINKDSAQPFAARKLNSLVSDDTEASDD